MIVEYQGAHWFPVAPAQLWDTIAQLDEYGSWWSWLQDFRFDALGLVDGNVLHGTVVPPVPYRVQLEVHLESCRRPHLLQAAVDGDLRGRATIALAPLRDGTEVTARWSLDPSSLPMRVAWRVVPPVMQWGHDRVVDIAVSGFRRQALARR